MGCGINPLRFGLGVEGAGEGRWSIILMVIMAVECHLTQCGCRIGAHSVGGVFDRPAWQDVATSNGIRPQAVSKTMEITRCRQ